MNEKTQKLSVLTLVAVLSLGALARAQTSPAIDQAAAALKAGNLPKAAAILEPLTGADSKDAAAFHLLSQVRLAQKNTQGAVEQAEKATSLDGTKADYFSQLGVALGHRMGEVGFMQQGMMAGKLKGAFAKAVALNPNDISGLMGLARYYSAAPAIAGGSVEKAREYAVRLQQVEPYLGALELGQIAANDEAFAVALEHYEAAAKLKPDSASAQHQCGRMLAKLGRKDEARARFEAALARNANFQPAQKSLLELGAPAP